MSETELPLHLVAPFPGNKTEHARIAGGGIEQAGEHFQHGGFAGAVGPEKADQLAFLDLKGDIVRGARFLVFAPDESLDRTAQSRSPLR